MVKIQKDYLKLNSQWRRTVRTKLNKQEYDSFKDRWIKDSVYYMDRDQLENYAMLYFQEDLKNQDQEDAFETMQSIDDEVFTTLANKFNLEVSNV